MTLDQHRVAFIGTGQMATALAAGFARTLLRPQQISGTDPSAEARTRFVTAVGEGTRVTDKPEDLMRDATVVIVAVKPGVVSAALKQIAPLVTAKHLIVSVAAGISLEALAANLPQGTRLIRTMPNTPCLVGKGACGISASASALPTDTALLIQLLETVGLVDVVPESLLDAVTGLSGSGPAYAFQIIEALSDGGVRMGLPRATATRLAAQTLLGAAEMVLQTGKHPGELKDSVTSPGGTTIAGLHALERGALRAALMNAVEAATLRSQQLGSK
jgi:pyrroline-5-carboxylate reductase